MLTAFPSTIIANAANVAIVSVESINAVPGSNVTINVSVKDNPGIMAANFTVTYDEGLTLTDSKSGDAFSPLAMTKPENYNSPCKFSWDALDIAAEDVKDGIILTLSFTVDKDVKANTKLNVKLSYQSGNIIDNEMNDIPVSISNGSITVIDYIPGDINSDGNVDLKDVTLIRRLVTGYNVTANKSAADVNGDGEITMKDVVLIRRYVVDAEGYGVTLVPGGSNVHTHKMTATAEKAATCTDDGNTAYWYCEDCGKYFADKDGKTETTLERTVIKSDGHTIVVDPAVAPTYDSTGLTEGSHCSVCGYIEKAQTVVDKLEKQEFAITYHIANSDNYLASLSIENDNPDKYNSEDGLILKDLIVSGYAFKGWYTSQVGGTKITEIAKKATGNKVLYAQWEKIKYTIDFDSPDAPVSSIEYTVDRGTTLTSPSWFGYTFVGWSMDGKILSLIEPGTTGNLVLHANWTSNRNKAKAVDKLEDPQIIEDADNGRYLFIYEIGTIENVPLSEDKGEQINSEGITITKELAMSQAVETGVADKIAKTVSKATTETSSWTLSENWNNSASATNEHDEQVGKTKETTDSEGNIVAGKYYVSNSKGGSTAVSSSSGGSASNSSKVTTGASIGINGEYSHKTNDGTSVDVSVGETKENEFDWNIGGSYGRSNTANMDANASGTSAGLSVGLSAGLSAGKNWGINGSIGGKHKTTNTQTVSANASHEEENALKISNSRNYNVGTETNSTSEGHWDTSSSSSSNWNSTSGYEASNQTSTNKTVSDAISEVINDKYSYTSTSSTGGNNSNTRSTSDSSSSSDEYASTVEYSTENTVSEKKTLQFKSSATGYYRVITAGTIHVFGVVGYDIATNSYFTYTYNILDSERHAYLDYSKDNSNFTDCENGVIPFEIPHDVHDYISVKIGKTSGLRISESTGMVTAYTGTADYVVIPEYVSVNDGLNAAKAVKVTGFTKDAFAGNQNIKGVLIPKHIRSIPDNAFEGCTNLRSVIGYGINSIGSAAFKNCTSLKTFIVDEFVEHLGSDAFENTDEVYFNAANASVAEAALNSKTKHLILSLSEMTDDFNNRKIVVSDKTEFFALLSNGKTYKNLSIESNAEETFLSNFKLTENKDTPLKLNSSKITLSRVEVVDCPGFALIIPKDNAVVNLYGDTKLHSIGENSVITKNIEFKLLNNEVDATLDISGDYLINGDIVNKDKINVTYNKLTHITSEQFENYLSSSTVTFNANGGSINESSKTVYYGQFYGEMPVPTRTGYAFDGWYTAAAGGTKITAETVVSALANQTLYAHWTANAYNVNWNNGTGYTITVKRTSSPIANAATGSLSKGAVVYYGDVLSVNYSANTGYSITSTGKSSITVDGNVTASAIYATASVNSYTASWNTGTGYSISVKRTDSPKAGASIGNIGNGSKVYYGDVLSVSYNKQDYYTITSKGVTSITVTGNVTSSNIYASATLNSVSGWVKASEVPSGAQIVSTEWRYTLREYTTNSSSSLSGWTKYDTKRTSWGSWSDWSTTNPSNGERNVESRKEYHYYRWIDSRGYVYTYQPNSSYWLEEKWFTTELPVYDNGSQGTSIRVNGSGYKNRWVKADYEGNRSVSKTFTRTTYRYQDPVYTYYYYRDLSKTASSDPTGQSNVSNVVKWVTYRAK